MQKKTAKKVKTFYFELPTYKIFKLNRHLQEYKKNSFNREPFESKQQIISPEYTNTELLKMTLLLHNHNTTIKVRKLRIYHLIQISFQFHKKFKFFFFNLIFIVFFTLPFSPLISPPPSNHHTVVLVHESFFFFCSIPPTPNLTLPLAVIILSYL